MSHLYEHGWHDILDVLLTYLTSMEALKYGHFPPVYRISEQFRRVQPENALGCIAVMRQ